MRLLLGEIAGQAQIRDAHMTMLVQEDVGRLRERGREGEKKE